MCLKVKSELRIAKTDLYTIKKLNIYNGTTLRSPYYKKHWKIGIIETAKMGEKKKKGDYASKGFHSLIQPTNNWFRTLDKYCVIMICRIPKGSKYYLGKGDDIISNQLEIVEKGWEYSKFTRLSINNNGWSDGGVKFSNASKKAIKLLESKYGKQQY